MRTILRTSSACLFTFAAVLICGASFAADYYVSNTTGYAPEVTSAHGDFLPLADGDTLTLKVDRGPEQTVTFHASDFHILPIDQARAVEICNVLNSRLTGITASWAGNPAQIRISSNRTDAGASIQVTGGTANEKFGFPTDEFVIGDGSQSRPFGSISCALRVVNGTPSDPANLRVAAGTYYENLDMKNYINLLGGYDPLTWTRDIRANETVLYGAPLTCVRFVRVMGGAVDGFTITKGSWGDIRYPGGGGIFCDSSSPLIQNNIITDNGALAAMEGGGIHCRNYSSPIIQDNIIVDNESASGGGILCVYSSSPTIRNNVIIDNQVMGPLAGTGPGGAIACHHNSSPTIQDNIISGNLSDQGGGIALGGSCSPIIEDNIISGNLATAAGGGIACETNSLPMIRNNIICGNRTAGGFGGALYCWDSSPTLQNNTIVGNEGWYLMPDPANEHVLVRISAGGGVSRAGSSSPLLVNNLFYANGDYAVYEEDAAGQTRASYNEFYGNLPAIWYHKTLDTTLATIAEVNAWYQAGDNISVPPGFASSLTGTSTDVTYGPTTFQSTLTDTSATFTPGALVGLLLSPNTNEPFMFPIVSNTQDTITFWGDISAESEFGRRGYTVVGGEAYGVFDYHLSPSSALIDAGADPGDIGTDINGDTRPQGARYDIGADEFVGIPAPIIGEGEGEPEERILDEEAEAEEEPSLPVEDAGDNEDASPTPTPSVLTLCPAARTTASTALAAKIDRLRNWRDEGLLATRLGEMLATAYYRIQPNAR